MHQNNDYKIVQNKFCELHSKNIIHVTNKLCHFQDEEQLLKIKKMLEEKGDSTRGIKKQLFMLYCRSKDLEKVEQIMKVIHFLQLLLIKIY
jgi:hypothetical protein